MFHFVIAIDDPGKSSLKPSIGDDSLDYLNIMNILRAKGAHIKYVGEGRGSGGFYKYF